MEPKRSFLSEFPKSTGFVGNLSLMKGWGLRHIINYMICRGGFFAEKNASILGPTVSFPWWSCWNVEYGLLETPWLESSDRTTGWSPLVGHPKLVVCGNPRQNARNNSNQTSGTDAPLGHFGLTEDAGDVGVFFGHAASALIAMKIWLLSCLMLANLALAEKDAVAWCEKHLIFFGGWNDQFFSNIPLHSYLWSLCDVCFFRLWVCSTNFAFIGFVMLWDCSTKFLLREGVNRSAVWFWICIPVALVWKDHQLAWPPTLDLGGLGRRQNIPMIKRGICCHYPPGASI